MERWKEEGRRLPSNREMLRGPAKRSESAFPLPEEPELTDPGAEQFLEAPLNLRGLWHKPNHDVSSVLGGLYQRPTYSGPDCDLFQDQG